MAKGKKKTTLWVVLAAVILAIFALGKLGGSEPGTTAQQTTAAVTETTVQTTDTTTVKQTAGTAKAKTAAKKKQTAANVPAFSGKPYVVLDDNQPRFSAKDKKRRSAYESYAPLDSLGRCGVAFACLCKETMPTEKRGEIGQVRLSGWHTVKYDTVDGKYLYNRCHLIGYQLSAENANTRNLITGTRYLNTQGMLPFENLVADYIKETGTTGSSKSSAKSTKKHTTEPKATKSAAKSSGQSSRTVYTTPTGRCYHYLSGCGGKNSKKTTLKEAKSRGLRPCKKCAA